MSVVELEFIAEIIIESRDYCEKMSTEILQIYLKYISLRNQSMNKINNLVICHGYGLSHWMWFLNILIRSVLPFWTNNVHIFFSDDLRHMVAKL